MGNMTAEVMDVKGAFLKWDIEDGEEIHLKIPQGWEHHYNDKKVLKMVFWRQLLKMHDQYGNTKKRGRSLSLFLIGLKMDSPW